MRQENIGIEIRSGGKRIQAHIDTRPCYSRGDKFIGVIISIRERSRSSEASSLGSLEATRTFNDIIGNTTAINNARSLARQVAASTISVLLSGESGTGKEMFAQAIHNESDLSDGPFVSLNCAAIPLEIAESELFGYSRGAFTGALKEGRTGKLEAASGGTLFLDEIGDMPLEVQAKFLRVLESKVLTRVGENREVEADFRLIAATNSMLKELVEKKLFREDLYYRIAVSTIHLPPLRETAEDIPELFMGFVEYYNEQMGKEVERVKEGFLEQLKTYPWKGNIRELRNAAEYAVMFNSGSEPMSVKHLPGDIRMAILYYQDTPIEESSTDPLQAHRQGVAKSERELILQSLERTGGDVLAAARALGMSRATLYRRLKKYSITL